MNKLSSILSKLADRRDLWSNPVKASIRHISWMRYWRKPSPPYLVLNKWCEEVSIALPNTSNSKLAYCGRHPERSIVSAMDEHLFPGSIFVDVGAHIGVYSLVAAKRVGPTGLAIAIEPQSVGIAAIQLSASLNGFDNLRAIHGVLGSASGTVTMDFETFGAVVAGGSSGEKRGLTVPCWTLDDLADENQLKEIHLLKLDAGGNEASVLQGAEHLLKNHQLKAVVMKLYNPDVVQHRFGRSAWDAVSWLRSNGYATTAIFHGRHLALKCPDDMKQMFSDGSYCHILVATIG